MTHQLLFLGSLGSQEIIIIALVILLLFGGKKIPELMRGLGKGVSQFKKGMNDIENKNISYERHVKKIVPQGRNRSNCCSCNGSRRCPRQG